MNLPFNAGENHAQYTNNFFQLYDQIITPNFITYPFGNFLPLNTIDDSSKATQVGAINHSGGMKTYVEQTISDLKNNTEGLGSTWKATQNQLVTMLEEYKENWTIYPRTINGTSNDWDNLSPANAIRDYFWGDTDGNGDNPSNSTSFITQEYLNSMYNIDWDVQTNFFFGMEMKMNFMMPKDGMTGNDKDGDGDSDYKMKFKFTGDDDVWVYIDGVLFLDLSGIHRHVGGEIDFVNGKVYYYNLDTAGTGDVSSTPYITKTFAEILKAAGADTSVLNDNGTFKDYSTHEFNFYYMERGSGSSVCRLNFNFPLLKKNSLTVSKESVPDEDVELLGNPDYYFNVVKNTNTELFIEPGTSYQILDSAGNEVGTGTVDEYGIFTLKSGQTAVFENIPENAGKYYVQELIKDEDRKQYKDKVTINGQDSSYNALITWDRRTWYIDTDGDSETGPYGYKWYGYSSASADASNKSSFYFEALNGVVTDNLGKLSITKKLNAYDATSVTTATYKMYVELDGVPLPKGTKYTVGSTTKTVTDDGYIELKANETAIIENILSGTKFKVLEDAASSAGYNVQYEASNADEKATDGSSISGVIRQDTTVSVIVTNNESGATVTIPVTKTVANPDGEEHTFNFKLQEVTDINGNSTVTGGVEQEASIVVSDGSVEETIFSIIYFEKDFSSLPVTKYYKVVEVGDDDSAVKYDTSVYVVEVTISKVGDNLQANITNVYKDGTAVEVNDALTLSFTNTLLRNLTLTKVLEGSSITGTPEFTFEITLTQNGEALSGT